MGFTFGCTQQKDLAWEFLRIRDAPVVTREALAGALNESALPDDRRAKVLADFDEAAATGPGTSAGAAADGSEPDAGAGAGAGAGAMATGWQESSSNLVKLQFMRLADTNPDVIRVAVHSVLKLAALGLPKPRPTSRPEPAPAAVAPVAAAGAPDEVVVPIVGADSLAKTP